MRMPRPLILLNADVEPEAPYDSLRVRLPAAYGDAVAESGGLPVVVSPTSPPAALRAAVAHADGVLFIGGRDYPPAWFGEPPHPETRELSPVRATADRILAEAALARPIPVFGVCGGHQLLVLACGGRLIQHLPQAAAHAGNRRHDITIRGGRILQEIFGAARIEVNSYHHQAACAEAWGGGLLVTARADDGVIEGVEGADPARFLLGVQWHPERMEEPHRRRIFGAFVEACGRRA
jgi:putative glutamine amidotransferase